MSKTKETEEQQKKAIDELSDEEKSFRLLKQQMDRHIDVFERLKDK